jgi:5'-nucleotidase (lipoprotein e(P4) family)
MVQYCLTENQSTDKSFAMNTIKTKYGKVVAAALCMLCVGCAPATQTDWNPGRDMLMALVWQQSSGEYTALCHQAFNAGKAYLASLEERPPRTAETRRAVVLDIDETVLDNSPCAARLVRKAQFFGGGAWEAWCKAAAAEAVPGSLDFTLFAAGRGIDVFYVSNRSVSVFEGTMANLKKLGFPMADAAHILLKSDVSDKTPRLDRIRAQGYEIVLRAGDNLDDFTGSLPGLGNPQRKAWAAENRESFGAYRIVLPNAAYGSFEAAITKGYDSLSPEKRAEERLKILKVWEM